MKKIIVILLFIFLVGGFLFFRWIEKEAFFGTAGASNVPVEFEVTKGEGTDQIATKLEQAELIENRYFFLYYLWRKETDSKLQAGVYELSPNMTIGEIIEKISNGKIKTNVVKLTVPPYFTNQKIIDRLREKKPEIADEFEQIVTCKCLGEAECTCDRFSQKYEFLTQIPKGVDMEGYLFPDTYHLTENETGATLVSKFLNNFEKKVNGDLKKAIENQDKDLHQIITMASVIEREAKTDEDRKLVAGVFWNRINQDHPLQSCATLAYFLGIDKPQFSYEDTQTPSEYNTYLNPGLPPGPICNPGLSSIEAAVFPAETDYFYFLSDPETGEMVYSKTSQEHAESKLEHGL